MQHFSQMHVVKTDWRNWLNEENLTNLLWVKVNGLTTEEFHGNHRGKAVTLWYNDWSYRVHQPQQKEYKKIDKRNRITKF